MSARVIMITGAAGFVGRHTVAAARARGHKVVALVRRSESVRTDWNGDTGITPVVCDLATDQPALDGVETVIHTAASLTGDDATQKRETLAATGNLLAAIKAQNRPVDLVLASSISVYDTMALAPFARLDETTPIEPNPEQRDAYCRAKLAQEQLCQQAELAHLSILRIGAVFGPGQLWNSHLGVAAGPVLLRIGAKGEVPLCHVTHCAKALVLAAETPVALVNVLDDDRPERARFVAALRQSGWPKWVIPVPWRLWALLAKTASLLPIRLPGLLRLPVLHARLKPLRYSNAALHEQLGWTPEISFNAALQEARP
ncbi:MAG: hypothetical protein CSA68_02890 [Rhodobacterales bacterium]|nr:MAG: hypothetical protein CSA68_02890 [Rhodobacterales bacterium]